MNLNKIIKSEILNEQYTYIKHKSGLEVYIFPKELTISYAIITAKFGSIDNNFKIGDSSENVKLPDGCAHFLEHKMFDNADGEDTFLKFSRTGANANAFTSFRDTSYVFSCTDNLYKSLRILLESVFSPYFSKESIKKEQGIIAQEIKMGEDDPFDVLLLDILRCLYKNSALSIDIAGSVESISKITPEILYKCHHTFYNPSNMILCVCGQANPEKVQLEIDRVLPDTKPVNIKSIYPKESRM